MITYLHGPDSYRRTKKLQELISNYKEQYRDIDIFGVDLDESPDDWQKVGEFLNQPSMFVDLKLAIIKEGGIVDEKKWIKILKSYLETTKTFVLISDREPPKKSFKFLLEKPARAYEFNNLQGSILNEFLKQEIISRGLFLAPDAWRFFLAYISAHEEKGWRAVTELDKIALVKFPNPISLVDMQKVVHWTSKENAFFLGKNLLQSGPIGKRLGVLERLLFQKEAPPYLFNLLAYQTMGGAALKLADYDVSIKSGKLDYEEALTDFVISS